MMSSKSLTITTLNAIFRPINVWGVYKETMAEIVRFFYCLLDHSFKIACMHTTVCVLNLLCALSNQRFMVLTHTHGAALAVNKRRDGTGHWRACNLVTNNLGLLPSMNIRHASG